MRLVVIALLVAPACRFEPGHVPGGGGDDDDDGGIADAADGDADPYVPPVVAHVSASDEANLISTTSWIVDTATTFDTGTGMATPALPAGLFAMALAQEGGGPELFVIQGARIEVSSTLTVIGTRPLVLVASDEIVIGGMLDASAKHATPGPGGAAPSDGPGAGPDGKSDDGSHDAGGAGGSFGSVGNHGGDGGPGSGTVVTTAPAAAAIYGDMMLSVLQGGSGGGDSSPACSGTAPHGGAGGGAIQLTASTITIGGTIIVGGGGAEGVSNCAGNGFGGGGGGSGGAVYVEAALLAGSGTIAANGGGGSGTGSSGGTGQPGEDAHADTTAAAGGTGVFGAGGAGAALAAAQAGQQGDNGGGGGGGGGRIFLAIPIDAASPTVTSTPLASRAL